MNIEIANNLVQLRKKSGLSQEALAEKLGLSRQAVSKWERAEASPDTDNLVALAKLYGVSLNELLMMDETDTNNSKTDTNDAASSTETSEDGANKSEYDVEDASDNSENNNAEYVHIGLKGIHVKDKDNEVHIGFDGIHVNERGGNFVDIDKNAGVVVNGEKYSCHKINFWYKFPFAVIVVIAYLCLGMFMNLWHPAWLLFLIIPIYYSLIDAIAKRKPHHFAYPVLAALAFLCLGFFGGFWNWGWIVFLTVPIYYCIFPEGNKHGNYSSSCCCNHEDE